MKDKKYQGQTTKGYGGVYDCDSYVKDRYGEDTSLKKQKMLPVDLFTMGDLAGDANNCVLTGITKILCFYLGKKRKISAKEIYEKVKVEAVQKGYTVKKGLGFHKISSVFKSAATLYELSENKARGIYCFGLFRKIKKEIDAGRPLLMNISFGYYRNHTVTVIGYKIYQKVRRFGFFSLKRTFHIVVVSDGWTNKEMYIDYQKFHVPASVTIMK